jgi:hypothetical protein
LIEEGKEKRNLKYIVFKEIKDEDRKNKEFQCG